jgi:hypothetical protein
MDRKKDRDQTAENVEDMYGGLNSVVSTTEATGLIPSRPDSADSANAYSEIYGVPVPEKYKDFKDHKKKS